MFQMYTDMISGKTIRTEAMPDHADKRKGWRKHRSDKQKHKGAELKVAE
jgi:hypothetical protein